MPVIVPERLKKGDLVALVCMSGAATEDRLMPMWDALNDLGLLVRVYGNGAKINECGEAGSPKRRHMSLHNAFFDDDIKAIFCLKGGAGALDLLKGLDYNLIAQNPKIFMGMSDPTCLQYAITRKVGLETYHGPMYLHFKGEQRQFALDNVQKILFDDEKEIDLLPKNVIRTGVASGQFVGGNLTRLMNLGVSQYSFDYSRPTILFLEEVGELKYTMTDCIKGLFLQGAFENVRGVVIGQNHYDKNDGYKKKFEECLLEVLPEGIPVVSGAKFGHKDFHLTLPIGRYVNFNAHKFGAKITF